MVIQIQAIHTEPSGSNYHEHIASLGYNSPSDPEVKVVTKEALVTWLNTSTANQAFVVSPYAKAEVKVVPIHPPYVRTVADGVWTDNLLALPRF